MGDRYLKVVLTAIAVALMWLCLWGPAPRWGTPAQAGAVDAQRTQPSPTPWAYHALYYTGSDGTSYSVLLRVNPVTDEMEYFTPSRMGIELGWLGVGPGRAPAPRARPRSGALDSEAPRATDPRSPAQR